jgi:amino acid adenylation domain-containing protein
MDSHTDRTTSALLALVAQQARARPGRVAVRAPDVELTYAELDERADVLARALHAVGVGPGDRVFLRVPRSAALVVGALGIARAGAAYIASDSAYPAERLRWMLGDSGARALVADAGTATRLDCGVPVVALDGLGRSSDAGGQAAAPDVSPAELAYIVYTSGSTGRPKGVEVRGESLANLVAWHHRAFALGGEDECTQIASPGFDAAVWEVWPAIAAGATLNVVPEELRGDPRALRDWLVAARVTVSFIPTGLAEMLLGLDWPADAPLRYMLTGGDALGRRPPAGLPFALVNNYGLSETTVVATSGPVDPLGAGMPSIGTAIDGVELEVVDERLEPVAPGAPGELLVGGVALARGYVNQPELTAERFVLTPRGRFYRTGDSVRENAAGELEFLGRLDDQLSIRGFRIEPGEVVAALRAHPAVATAAVAAHGESSASRSLVAYLVPAAAEQPEREELIAFLADRLPDYMLPSRIVWLDQLPLTANGKVDREALDGRVRGEAAEPDIGAVIAAIVAALLGVPGVGEDQNFFLLGGHSMLGAQLIVRIEERFGAVISLRFLFDHPTPAELAGEVARQIAAGARPDAMARS